MLRNVALLAVGASIGAVAVLLAYGGNGERAAGQSASLLDRVADATFRRSARTHAEALSASTRLASYRDVAATADPGELERMLARSAASEPSPLRDLEIDSVLMRMAELDPAHAVDAALTLGVEARFLVAVFQRWAESDTTGALDGLSGIADTVARRAVALGLLDNLGHSLEGFERVAAALPAGDRSPLLVHWFGVYAATDPYGALRDAEQIWDENDKRAALVEIATSWARRDPEGALLQAEQLTDSSLRNSFVYAVTTEWARLDLSGYLAYFESAASEWTSISSGGDMQLLLAVNPEAVIRVAERMQPSPGQITLASAFGALAETDPLAAIARVETLPAGSDRNQVLQSIATSYARRDADAALAWAQSLEPPSPDAVINVATVIAETDVGRALDLIRATPSTFASGMNLSLGMGQILSRAAQDPARAPAIARELVGRNDTQSVNLLRTFMASWMQSDSEAALGWLLANSQAVHAGALRAAASMMATSDIDAAMRYVDRIPATHRTAWITSVASEHAPGDPDGAFAWIERFRGDEVYDIAYREIVNSIATDSPRLAAEFLTRASPDVQLASASLVANRWTRQDGAEAAARWAASLSDERARASAMRDPVGAWADADPAAAGRWAMQLSRGEARDEALLAVMLPAAAAGTVDRGMLDALSSDTARGTAVRRAALAVSRTDPNRARALIDEHVRDPALRDEIYRQIEGLR